MKRIDYHELLASAHANTVDEAASFLAEELPYEWRDEYVAFCDRQTDIVRIQHGTFEYIYDDYRSLEKKGLVPPSPTAEARVVGVCGMSAPLAKPGRNDTRLRGWIGRTEKLVGKRWDKGHFIGHSLGGVVDGFEANVYWQRRDLNRGWSAEGKKYRRMETFCTANPGTFCFCRPIYADDTSRPTMIEYGVLREVNDLWVACFDNT
jgi:hypothetical protein